MAIVGRAKYTYVHDKFGGDVAGGGSAKIRDYLQSILWLFSPFNYRSAYVNKGKYCKALKFEN